MSTGGIFQLITNDGKQDKLLMATELLNKRLSSIRKARAAAGLDPTPTLADIEKTHMFFTNATFKPYTAIASEYNKVKGGGLFYLGNSVDFSIPQFGDFFSDMVLYVKLDASTVYQPQFGMDTMTELGRLQFCPWLGERLLEKVSFTVNGNPLDEYTPNSANVYREFYMHPEKKDSYSRCVGQETEELAYGEIDNQVSFNSPYRELSNCRQVMRYVNGLQTPKTYHGPTGDNRNIELWIPLQFWFNKDTRLAIPSVAIPYGQRYIKVQLAGHDKIIRYNTGKQGLYNRGSENWTDKGWATKNAAPKNYVPQNIKVECDLYINNLFVNPEIHEIFIKRVGFNLIRVHREQTVICEQDHGEVLLNHMKWPIESLFVGMRPYQYSAPDKNARARYIDRWDCFEKKDRKIIFGTGGMGLKREKLGAGLYNGTFVKASDTDVGYIEVTPETADSFKGDTAIRKGATYLVTSESVNSEPRTALVMANDSPHATWTRPGKFGDYVDTANHPLRIAVLAGDLSNLKTNAQVQFYGVAETNHSYDLSGDFTTTAQGSNTVTITNINSTLPDDTYYGVSPGDLSQGPDSSVTLQCVRNSYYTFTRKPTIKDIRITAHGIPLYDTTSAQFFTKYAPYHYAGPRLCSPKEKGWLMINFCLYPGAYQPSGHINVSRAREFYLEYNSDLIGQPRTTDETENQKGELVIVASALNFLLISDGSAVLRYST